MTTKYLVPGQSTYTVTPYMLVDMYGQPIGGSNPLGVLLVDTSGNALSLSTVASNINLNQVNGVAFSSGNPLFAQLVAGSTTIGNVGQVSPYPTGATPINGTSGDHAHTSNQATLAATSGKTTYICGFEVWATGATSAAVVDVTVADGTWTFTYPLNVPASSAAVQLQPITVRYVPAVPASAANTAIVVTCPSLGTGNTNAAVNAFGFQM